MTRPACSWPAPVRSVVLGTAELARRANVSDSSTEMIMPRELIEPHKGDKRYVRRAKGGKFKTEVDVGRSLAADRRSKSRRVVKKGEGDRGDQKRH
jgi:hypothetical protein